MTDKPEQDLTETDPETAFADLEVAAPRVGIIMGSKSDMPEMEKAGAVLEEAGIAFEIRVMSAHRDPDTVADYCRNARMRGLPRDHRRRRALGRAPGRRRGAHRPPRHRRPAVEPPQRRGRARRDPLGGPDAAGRPGRVRRARQREERRPPGRAAPAGLS